MADRRSRNARLVLLAFLVVGLFAPAVSASGPYADVMGEWWFPDRSGQVEIYRKEGRLFGRVVSYRDSDQLDENNPDPALRRRRFVGIDMIADFQFSSETERWEDGTIYDADSGRTYRGLLWIDPGDVETLWARGYVGLAIFGRTERFTRGRGK